MRHSPDISRNLQGRFILVLNCIRNWVPDHLAHYLGIFDGNLAIDAHHYGEDPLAELCTMLGRALLNASGTWLEDVYCQKRSEASTLASLRVMETIGPDAVARFHLSGDEALLEKLGHNAGAFARVDIQGFPQVALKDSLRMSPDVIQCFIGRHSQLHLLDRAYENDVIPAQDN